MTQIAMNEIYASIQGEGIHFGRPTVFVRFQGCHVGCSWCDSKYTWAPEPLTPAQLKFSQWMGYLSPREVADRALSFGINYISITGGEPLEQPDGLTELCEILQNEGCEIEIWSSLTEPIPDPLAYLNVSFVADWKPTSAGTEKRTLTEGLQALSGIDQLKTVIGSRADWDEFIQVLETNYGRRLDEGFTNEIPVVSVSPVFGDDGMKQSAQELVQWIMDEKRFDIRLSIQQHKLIWDSRRRGV